jgi:hypothetical protein
MDKYNKSRKEAKSRREKPSKETISTTRSLPVRLDTTKPIQDYSKPARLDSIPGPSSNIISQPGRLDSVLPIPGSKSRPVRLDTMNSHQREEVTIGRSNLDSTKSKSCYQSSYDRSMAEKQTRIETLAPEERKKQDSWAREKLMAGACVAGLSWHRISGGT